jgi:uncharacterized protein (TIGR02996 family)
MTNERALLAAIIANPDDDTVRLVYADFLEENGEAERAEFIRLQVELARGVKKPAQRKALERRERGLLAKNKSRWVAPLAKALGSGRWLGWNFRRGFVERFEIPGKTAVSRGGKVAALTPVRELTVTPATTAQVVSLCKQSWLANLTHLYLPRIQVNDAAVKALTASPYLRRLRDYTDGGAQYGWDLDNAFTNWLRAIDRRKRRTSSGAGVSGRKTRTRSRPA